MNQNQIQNWVEGKTAFGREHGCKTGKRRFTLEGLASARFKQAEELIDAHYPGDIGDHTRFWIKNRKPFAITTEPYHLDLQKLEDLRILCDKLGLVMAYRSDKISEWNPDGCKWIEIFAENLEVAR
jgi:hypothetical protein